MVGREQPTEPRGAIWRRYAQIANVLTRHGLDAALAPLGLDRYLSLPRRVLGPRHRPAPLSRPEHVRLCLEELGATFVKLGQILSTRADLLPPDYLAELAKLQDAAPPVATSAVRRTIEDELGAAPEDLFAWFDPESLAAASIGQVHAARLRDGTEVVVKVRRPGVAEQVELDLEILRNLAAAASRHWQLAADYDVVALAEEFGQTLRSELDYLREGRDAERFERNFAGDATVHVPRIIWAATTSRVLTLERLRGVKISDLAALDLAGIDRRSLAERASRAVLKMVFEDGFFHADPHPGNFFVEPDGRIGLIDFGMVGHLDERTRWQLAQLVAAITGGDPDRLVDAFLDLGFARRRVDRAALRRDLERLITRYYGQPLGEIRLGPLIDDAFGIVRRHRLHVPPNLALLLKTGAMSEGLGAQLDPSFRLPAILAPYARRLLLQQFEPERLFRRVGQAGFDAATLSLEFPRQVRRLLGEVERGHFAIGVRPEDIEPILRRLDRVTNRLVLGVITAAFINGLAVLLFVYHPPDLELWIGYAFGFGLILTALLGCYLAWSILRSSR